MMSLSGTTLSHRRRSSAVHPVTAAVLGTRQERRCGYLCQSFLYLPFRPKSSSSQSHISFSCPTAVPLVSILVLVPAAVIRFSVRFATPPPLLVIIFLSSASNPKSHLRHPFLNYVSDLPDSNLSFPQSLHRPRPSPATSLPDHHSHVNLVSSCT